MTLLAIQPLLALLLLLLTILTYATNTIPNTVYNIRFPYSAMQDKTIQCNAMRAKRRIAMHHDTTTYPTHNTNTFTANNIIRLPFYILSYAFTL